MWCQVIILYSLGKSTEMQFYDSRLNCFEQLNRIIWVALAADSSKSHPPQWNKVGGEILLTT